MLHLLVAVAALARGGKTVERAICSEPAPSNHRPELIALRRRAERTNPDQEHYVAMTQTTQRHRATRTACR
ncbi:hypothetical protein [Sphingomonas sp.]|uniref:hypothetical protein n=1 Tax=Sphingomonas sp. TaxID=28214 RepID=UPI0035C82E15